MYRILIVEDEFLLQSELALCEDWQTLGFEPPLLAGDGEQGLNIAVTECPDVVLTDIRMPKMDGLQMLLEIKRRKLKCVCIVLSGYDDFNYAVEALHCGVMDYLLKPIDPERLHQALSNAISKIREQEESTDEPALKDSAARNVYLQRAVEYIREHYAEDLPVTTVAQKLYITDTYLGRLFVREYHMRFSEYLNQIRIQNAVRLLRDPQWKLYQIAQMCGYRDQQYFSNVFKKMMGISPNQFRTSIGIATRKEKT